MKNKSYMSHIEISPDKRFGKPCIRGTRVAVTDILEMMADGMSIAEIIAEHTYLNQEQIKAALAYASEHVGKGAAA
jgi:uncharacterized protein (DUF433 family)